MSTDPLKRAYDLIKSGQKEQAIPVLLPILKADRDNVNAWWLLANAAAKKDQIEFALNNVLRLKPEHAQAQAMLDKIKPPPPPPIFESDIFDEDVPEFPELENFVPTKRTTTTMPPIVMQRATPAKKAQASNQWVWIGLASIVGICLLAVGIAYGLTALFPGSTPPESVPGWQKLAAKGIEIQVPPSYLGIDDPRDISQMMDEVRGLGPEFEEAVRQFEENPDMMVLMILDPAIYQGYATNINITKEDVGAITTLKANVDSMLRHTPPQVRVVERTTKKLPNYTAERLILESNLFSTSIRQLVYVIKKSNTVWVITFTTHGAQFSQRLPIFEQSIETFYIR